MTEGQRWYRNYLLSEHWRELRLVKLEEVGYKCEKCGRKSRLEVHHLKYCPYKERLSDLQVLCEEHHEQTHAIQHEALFQKKESSKDKPKKARAIPHKELLPNLMGAFNSGSLIEAELVTQLSKIKRKILNGFMNANKGTAFSKQVWKYLKAARK
jgi:hypothetical protein